MTTQLISTLVSDGSAPHFLNVIIFLFFPFFLAGLVSVISLALGEQEDGAFPTQGLPQHLLIRDFFFLKQEEL